MTHYHDVTLTDIDSICEKLFPHIHSKDDMQQLKDCLLHRNFKKESYDCPTSSWCIDIERRKSMYKEQRCNTCMQLTDNDWDDSCTFTSIHTMFAFCSLIIGITNGNDKNVAQKLFENMRLCIVCEGDAKKTVSILLNALSLYTRYLQVQNVVYTHLKHIDNDSLYLHKLANDIIGELEDDQFLHLLVLPPVNKMMVPGIDKHVSDRLSYTALTGINKSMSFPPMTIPPCFTGVISTITVESTLPGHSVSEYNPVIMSAKMEVQKYCHDIGCVCGHNIEYEEDVIHSHYMNEDEDEEYSCEGNSSYQTAYFQNIGKHMPRSKFMNEINSDCLGCKVVARIIASKRSKTKRLHEISDDILYQVKHTRV